MRKFIYLLKGILNFSANIQIKDKFLTKLSCQLSSMGEIISLFWQAYKSLRRTQQKFLIF